MWGARDNTSSGLVSGSMHYCLWFYCHLQTDRGTAESSQTSRSCFGDAVIHSGLMSDSSHWLVHTELVSFHSNRRNLAESRVIRNRTSLKIKWTLQGNKVRITLEKCDNITWHDGVFYFVAVQDPNTDRCPKATLNVRCLQMFYLRKTESLRWACDNNLNKAGKNWGIDVCTGAGVQRVVCLDDHKSSRNKTGKNQKSAHVKNWNRHDLLKFRRRVKMFRRHRQIETCVIFIFLTLLQRFVCVITCSGPGTSPGRLDDQQEAGQIQSFCKGELLVETLRWSDRLRLQVQL